MSGQTIRTEAETRNAPLSQSIGEEMRALGTATLYEAQGKIGAMDHGIKPLTPKMGFAGRALTVAAHPGDNLIVHYAVAKAQPGDVLVIDAQGFVEAGLWGDVLTEAAISAGIVGVVVDGAVRDAESICQMGLPVFARALSIKGTSKCKGGSVGEDIICGGTLVKQSDYIVGDRDGVVVIDSTKLNFALDASHNREQEENRIREGVRSGLKTVELMQLEDALANVGLSCSIKNS